MKELGGLLDKSPTQVLADNYAKLAAFYLPTCTAYELNPESPAVQAQRKWLGKSQALAKLVQDRLNESGSDRNNRYLCDNIPEIFADVLKQVHNLTSAVTSAVPIGSRSGH